MGRPPKIARTQLPPDVDLMRCEWLDVGYDTCQRCRVHRRLYSPLPLQAMRVCADCSQARALSTIPSYSQSGDDELDEDAGGVLAGQTLN